MQTAFWIAVSHKLFATSATLLLIISALIVGITPQHDAQSDDNGCPYSTSIECTDPSNTNIHRFSNTANNLSKFENSSEDSLQEYSTYLSIDVDKQKNMVELNVLFFDFQGNLIAEYFALINADGVIVDSQTSGDILVVSEYRGFENLIGLAGNAERLASLLPYVLSDTLSTKITQALASSLLKKALKSLVGLVVPLAGWIVFAISIGVTIYELMELADEIAELTELAEIDVDGYELSGNELRLAKRYCGEDGGLYVMSSALSEIGSKQNGRYYAAMHIGEEGQILISDRTITFDSAVNILKIDNNSSPLDFYTPLESDALSAATVASGVNHAPIHHDRLHANLNWGLFHYHHYLHFEGCHHIEPQYPAHGFYGEVIYRF